MGGKAWCCGPSSGGGGGLAAVVDTPTVDLEGDGSAGAPITAAVRLSSDAGNHLSNGSDGALFVPRPTPVFGEALLPAPVDMVGAGNDVWMDTGLSVTLPEAGVYEVTATVRTSITAGVAGAGSPFAVNMSGRLFNVTGGGALPGTDYTLQQVNTTNPSGQQTWVALSTFHRFVTAPGATTIMLQVSRNTINGTGVNVTGVQPGNSRLAYSKLG